MKHFWETFAKEINGIFIRGEAWHSDKVSIRHGDFKITLDNYTIYTTAGFIAFSRTYTRTTVPFISLDKFRFAIYKGTLLGSLATLFGAQDIRTGDPHFDKKFVIKSNDIFQIIKLLDDPNIRELLLKIKKPNVHISDRKGIWEEALPENERELSLYVNGRSESAELIIVAELMSKILDQLVRLKSIKSMYQ